QGLYAQATEAYLGALAISQEIHEDMGVAAIGHDLAEIYEDQGRYADAYNTLQRSLEIYERLKVKHDLAESRAPLARLLLERSRACSWSSGRRKRPQRSWNGPTQWPRKPRPKASCPRSCSCGASCCASRARPSRPRRLSRKPTSRPTCPGRRRSPSSRASPSA